MNDPDVKGEVAAWAQDARVKLELSPEQAVAMLPKVWAPNTLRKAEARSDDMSRPLWRALTELYPRLARERGVTIPPVPPFKGTAPAAVGDQAALVDAIRDLVDELRLSRIRQESFDEQVLALLAAATGGSPAREEQPSGSERAAPAGTAR